MLPFYSRELRRQSAAGRVADDDVFGCAIGHVAGLGGACPTAWGRKPILLSTLAGGIGAYLLLLNAGSFTDLVIARGGRRNRWPAISRSRRPTSSDITAPEDRTRGMGLFGAALVLRIYGWPRNRGRAGRQLIRQPLWISLLRSWLPSESRELRRPRPSVLFMMREPPVPKNSPCTTLGIRIRTADYLPWRVPTAAVWCFSISG